MVDRDSVLGFFKERSRKPLKFRELVQEMGLNSRESRRLKKILRQMTASGDLVLNKRGRYGPAEEMKLVTGQFEAHGDGYGFVISAKPGERDIFVPARDAMAAMDGDTVMARVEDARGRKGRVVRILNRVQNRIAGTLEITSGVSFVRPRNRTVSFDIFVPPEGRGNAKDGQPVIVEICEFPTSVHPATGRVVKLMGSPKEPSEEVETIIDEFGLPRRFPRGVCSAAKAYRSKPFGRRKDLRKLNTVTIDGERAKDFDDAVSVAIMDRGYKLWVHIADVGFYVGWGSKVDDEARKRGTSVYFPDRVIPMLPKQLSEDLCSLRPRVDRPAFTVQMDFDREGRRTGASFYPSVINSNERMTYTQVKQILVDQDDKSCKRYSDLLDDFTLMGELCSLIRQRRMGRGSLDFDLPEPEVLLDIQGRPESIIRAERNFAHLIIEEFMIAANEAVAEHLEGLGVPSLYRIHEEPDLRKVQEIASLARDIVRSGRKPGADVLRKILEAVKNRPEEEPVTYMVLRSLKQARYHTENAGHFGLASKSYTHFTSPIRRYPDLVVHRILRETLSSERLSGERREELNSLLPEMAMHSSRMERLADESEQTVTAAMRVWFMKDRVGEEFSARIIGLGNEGVRIRLSDYFIDGFLHISSLEDDYYFFNERNFTLRGRHTGKVYKFGQEITVRLDRVDLEERRLVFGI